MAVKKYLWPIGVIATVIWVTSWAVQSSAVHRSAELDEVSPKHIAESTVTAVNTELSRLRDQVNIPPAERADDLTILRRLSLALHGTIPSLEEIREFEQDQSSHRIDRWTDRMLADPRFNDYFAERLARSFVGVEFGQFLVFRRDRFISWLTKQLEQNRPYDEIVRDLISGTGVWTGNGNVNFITSGFADEEFDANKLTARSVRAFLGQRMDCAQCHDHPFDHWKQSDFEGIAAHFGQVELSLAGVIDKRNKEYVVEDSLTLEDRTVSPSVPFNGKWLGEGGSRREQLARWITHTDNTRFERAAANRVWALMFGRPFETDRPVDDLPDPGTSPDLAMLDILGKDFREHGYDLRHLVRVIVRSDAFRMSSVSPLSEQQLAAGESYDVDAIAEQIDLAERVWAVFPLIRLRPEQVIGSMLQANNVQTVNQNSHVIIRALKFLRERDFVDEFGDPGVEELHDRSGTIPQALLRMNGEFAKDLTEPNPFFSPGRILAVASTDDKKIETVYLCCLSRRPSDEELNYFHEMFAETKPEAAVQDLFWILFNSPEFSWNH